MSIAESAADALLYVGSTNDDRAKDEVIERIAESLMDMPEPQLDLAVMGIKIFLKTRNFPPIDELIVMARKEGVPFQ